MDQPAFPSANQVTLGDYMTGGHAGMTLRDYFAAAALQGLLAGMGSLMEPEWYANEAGIIADAMIAERNRND